MTARKLGTLEPVVYFYNYKDPAHPPGYILLAPFTDFSTPPGYERREASTLADVDNLQKVLTYQEMTAAERDMLYDEWLIGRKRAEVGDRLRQRMVSSTTSPYEREFIECYLKLREEKRAKHQQRFLERQCYLSARENDIPKGRGADQERVNTDRIG